MHWTTYDSPLGTLTLTEEDGRITGIRFPGRHGDLRRGRPRRTRPFTRAARPARRVLRRRAAHVRRRRSSCAAASSSTAVWEQLRAIPYGETVSYGAIALALGRMDHVRAVGAAVGSTPVPIVVPVPPRDRRRRLAHRLRRRAGAQAAAARPRGRADGASGSSCVSRLVAGVRRRRDVERRVAVEEPDGLEREAGLAPGHDRPVLRAHEVRHADRVPEHDVLVLQRAVRAPFRQPARARALVGVGAGREALVRVVARDPERVAREGGATADARLRLGEQRRYAVARAEPVRGRRAEAVAARRAADGPDARGRLVGVAAALLTRRAAG